MLKGTTMVRGYNPMQGPRMGLLGYMAAFSNSVTLAQLYNSYNNLCSFTVKETRMANVKKDFEARQKAEELEIERLHWALQPVPEMANRVTLMDSSCL